MGRLLFQGPILTRSVKNIKLTIGWQNIWHRMYVYIHRSNGTLYDGEVVKISYYRVTEETDSCLPMYSPI